MKLRKSKQRTQSEPHDDPQDVEQNHDSNRPDSDPNEKKTRKRKAKVENRTSDDTAVSKKDEVESRVINGAAGEGRGASKRQKNNPAIRKVKKSSLKEKSGGLKQKAEASEGNPEKRQHGRKSNDAQRSKFSEETNTQPEKRKVQGSTDFEMGENNLKSQKRRNKNKEPQGRDIGDKLDMLIEQYRSKYSKQSSNQTDGERQGSGKLRKWFQS